MAQQAADRPTYPVNIPLTLRDYEGEVEETPPVQVLLPSDYDPDAAAKAAKSSKASDKSAQPAGKDK